MKPDSWIMPEWMEPHRAIVEAFAGGNTAEDLMHRLDSIPHLSQTNIVVYVMACQVSAAISTLTRLHAVGALMPDGGETIHEYRHAGATRPCGSDGFIAWVAAMHTGWRTATTFADDSTYTTKWETTDAT